MRRLLALAAAASLLAGCGVFDIDRRPRDVTDKAQAQRLIAAMVEETLEAVAPGAPRTPGVHDGTFGECLDANGAEDGTIQYTTARQVAGLTQATVAAAEQRVTRLWRDKNLIVSRYPGPPGVTDLQTQTRGIEYLVRISLPGRRVTASGNTPCVRPD